MENLQQMVENIEFAQIEMKVVEGLKTGNQCLEEMHKIMSIEDVEKIMAETEDAIEYQRVRQSLSIFLSSLSLSLHLYVKLQSVNFINPTQCFLLLFYFHFSMTL